MSHSSIAEFFSFLASSFPVMCASDEFHFIPRVFDASSLYHRMEDFHRDRMEEYVRFLRSCARDFTQKRENTMDLEEEIDFTVLEISARSLLMEFERIRSWKHNPLFYLKIAFLGLDHALNKPATSTWEQRERLESRLRSIPLLLLQGENNLCRVPDRFTSSSLAMTEDCRLYLEQISVLPVFTSQMQDAVQEVLRSLHHFQSFLGSLPSSGERAGPDVQDVVTTCFGSKRTLEELFAIGEDEREHHLRHLSRLQREIDPGRDWRELYWEYPGEGEEQTGLHQLYGGEIERLFTFFKKTKFANRGMDCPVRLEVTPLYLRSVRSSASFAAAFSKDREEESYFYYSPGSLAGRGSVDDHRLDERLKKEVSFLTAHETFPGHHYLDCYRRSLENPVRSQVENPLFYEGWAYFAESLLLEYGYVKGCMKHLVHHKRCLWRAIRCMVDAGLASGRIRTDQAENLIEEAGFSGGEARVQVQRFRLNPGYQLCYTLGGHEIKKLRRSFAPVLGEDFYFHLLSGGEIPFHLAKKRLEAATNIKENSN